MIFHFTQLCFLAVLVSAHEEKELDIPYDSSTSTLQNDEVCWERCFQVEDTEYERFREVYDDFYRMGMEARRLKNIFGVNGTALLLDSSLAQFHATATNLDAEDTAAYLWDFQKNIASIVTFLTGADDDHNPFYLEQFNEDSAYTCDDFTCLQACQVDQIIHGGPAGSTTVNDTEIEPLQTGETSHRDGNVEAACAQAKRYMESATCASTSKNEMAIAILNSDIYSRLRHDTNHHSSSSSSSSSSSEETLDTPGPCFAHFTTRYAIGTHAAGWDEIEEFSSSAAHGFYIHDNEYTMAAARELRNCISTRCCSTTYLTALTATSCKMTNGKYGQTDVEFAGHAALTD